MRNVFKIALILAIAATFAVSCNHDNSYYESSYTTTIVNKVDGYPYYFITDDSTVIYPTNHSSLDYKPKQNDRMLLTFKPADINADPIYAEISGYQWLLTKDIDITDQSDTLGRDGARPQYMWTCGGIHGAQTFLNIQFAFGASESGIIHSVAVSREPENPIDENGYYNLQFHHDSNDDYFIDTYIGFLSIHLEEEFLVPETKGIRIRFDNIADKEVSYFNLDF